MSSTHHNVHTICLDGWMTTINTILLCKNELAKFRVSTALVYSSFIRYTTFYSLLLLHLSCHNQIVLGTQNQPYDSWKYEKYIMYKCGTPVITDDVETRNLENNRILYNARCQLQRIKIKIKCRTVEQSEEKKQKKILCNTENFRVHILLRLFTMDSIEILFSLKKTNCMLICLFSHRFVCAAYLWVYWVCMCNLIDACRLLDSWWCCCYFSYVCACKYACILVFNHFTKNAKWNWAEQKKSRTHQKLWNVQILLFYQFNVWILFKKCICVYFTFCTRYLRSLVVAITIL